VCIVVILCVPAAIIGGGYFVISFIAKLHRDLSRLHLRSAETPPNQYPFRSFAYDNMPLVIFACPGNDSISVTNEIFKSGGERD